MNRILIHHKLKILDTGRFLSSIKKYAYRFLPFLNFTVLKFNIFLNIFLFLKFNFLLLSTKIKINNIKYNIKKIKIRKKIRKNLF